ncbi:hypothetical protein UCMB321_2996 [Pseudomonas batumici]|uniref:Uncharacterized protein n=1 Tax=Pseudomonas batumici TaxID=226910 RepID=A0A0C2I8K0_9PSED|nr:hypothetical protein UCMB321_2996 [Pseudomonas batumici]
MIEKNQWHTAARAQVTVGKSRPADIDRAVRSLSIRCIGPWVKLFVGMAHA